MDFKNCNFVVILSFFLFAGFGSVSGCTCFEPQKSCDAINITCPDEYSIYRPNITASSGSCESTKCVTNDNCIGQPVDLRADIANCNLKKSCIIRFPTSPVFTQTCVEDASSLHVRGWQCIKNNEINDTNYFHGDICSDSASIGEMAERGIIRSHRNFPWNYDAKIIPEGKTAEEYCMKTIVIPTGEVSRVLVKVDFLDIDNEEDNLLINGHPVNESFTKIYTDTEVSFKFTSNCKFCKGGSGFVVCFRRLKYNETGNMSACEGIITRMTTPIMKTQSADELCDSLQECEETSESVSGDELYCSKCLSKPTLGRRCKRKCCKRDNIHAKCIDNVQSSSKKIEITTQGLKNKTTTLNGVPAQCGMQQLGRFCKRCANRCGRKNKEKCLACCSECKRKKGGRRKSRKGKGKGKKKNKSKSKKG